jgi:hypothetical protein
MRENAYEHLLDCYKTNDSSATKFRFGLKLIIDRIVPCSSDMNIQAARIQAEAHMYICGNYRDCRQSVDCVGCLQSTDLR